MSDLLVSVIVITYNSEQYVVETLDSIKTQTYEHLELIITDDGSTDRTVDLCKDWVKLHAHRFVRTEIITVRENTGIPANCNRGLAASKGEWVKLIAGDDVLLKDCITDLIELTTKNSSIRMVQSDIDHYRGSFKEENFILTRSLASHPIASKSITALQQHDLLLKGCFVNAPGTLIKKDLLNEMGGFDERFPLEDWPMWLRITKANNKIFYLNKTTVKYRVHSNSISVNNKSILFGDFYLKVRPFYKEKILPNVSVWHRIKINHEFYVKLIFDKLGLNRNYLPQKVLFNLLLFNFTAIRNYKPKINRKNA